MQPSAAINGHGLAGDVIVAFEKKALLSIAAPHSSASRIGPRSWIPAKQVEFQN
jgi:hypothetical protein